MCNNLAVTLYKQNKAKEARDFQERVSEKLCASFGIGDPDFHKFQNSLKFIQG